jgi:hypothetical protein
LDEDIYISSSNLEQNSQHPKKNINLSPVFQISPGIWYGFWTIVWFWYISSHRQIHSPWPMADFASCSAEELQQLAATLSDAERQTLREALRLLEVGTPGPGAPGTILLPTGEDR